VFGKRLADICPPSTAYERPRPRPARHRGRQGTFVGKFYDVRNVPGNLENAVSMPTSTDMLALFIPHAIGRGIRMDDDTWGRPLGRRAGNRLKSGYTNC
jgi:hypothetical protein